MRVTITTVPRPDGRYRTRTLVSIIDDEGRTRVIGEIIDRVFHKHVEQRKHKMWKYKGYGIQLRAFNMARRLEDIHTIVIHEDDTETTLIASVDTWVEKGIIPEPIGHHGRQIFLPSEFMTSIVTPSEDDMQGVLMKHTQGEHRQITRVRRKKKVQDEPEKITSISTKKRRVKK